MEGRLNLFFNAILIIYFFLLLLISYLFEPFNEAKVPWDFFYESYPKIAFSLAIALSLIVIFFGGKIFQIFWNSFISDMFNLRVIYYQEALSCVLMLAIVSL